MSWAGGGSPTWEHPHHFLQPQERPVPCSLCLAGGADNASPSSLSLESPAFAVRTCSPPPLVCLCIDARSTQAAAHQLTSAVSCRDPAVELLGRPWAHPGWLLTLPSQGVLFLCLCHGGGGGTGDTKHSPHFPSKEKKIKVHFNRDLAALAGASTRAAPGAARNPLCCDRLPLMSLGTADVLSVALQPCQSFLRISASGCRLRSL